jgi:hypothetical protein
MRWSSWSPIGCWRNRRTCPTEPVERRRQRLALLKQQGLGGDGADAAGAEELGKGDQQVGGKDNDFSHRADRIMTSGTCKTALSAPVPSHCEFATHSALRPFAVSLAMPAAQIPYCTRMFGAVSDSCTGCCRRQPGAGR